MDTLRRDMASLGLGYCRDILVHNNHRYPVRAAMLQDSKARAYAVRCGGCENMKYGICAPPASLETVVRVGCAYIECPVTGICGLSETERRDFTEWLNRSGISASR